MKKQNLNNKLAFKKAAISELNSNALIQINGGSTINGGANCSGCVCDPVLETITTKMTTGTINNQQNILK
jgi:hypothetical protein